MCDLVLGLKVARAGLFVSTVFWCALFYKCCLSFAFLYLQNPVQRIFYCYCYFLLLNNCLNVRYHKSIFKKKLKSQVLNPRGKIVKGFRMWFIFIILYFLSISNCCLQFRGIKRHMKPFSLFSFPFPRSIYYLS